MVGSGEFGLNSLDRYFIKKTAYSVYSYTGVHSEGFYKTI